VSAASKYASRQNDMKILRICSKKRKDPEFPCSQNHAKQMKE
jgi:hypothetical protein